MSDSDVIEEGFDLNRALRELRSLRSERQQNLNDLLTDIERALQAGKLTCRRRHNTERNTMSKRGVATLQLQASQLRRNLFYIMERERQILQRLKAIAEKSATNQAPSGEKGPQEVDESAAQGSVSREENEASGDGLSDAGAQEQSA